jgi:predicted outer membrane repeat protein
MVQSKRLGILNGSAAFAALGMAALAHAQTHVVYVDASRPSNGDGSSWNQAFRDLQEAFDSINALPTGSVLDADIEFRIAHGVYRPTETRLFSFTLRAPALTSAASVTIAGGYGGIASPTPDARDFVATPTVLTADVLGNDQPGFVNRGDNCSVVLCSGLSPSPTTRNAPYLFRLSGVILQGAWPNDIVWGSGFVAGLNAHEPGADTQLFVLEDCLIRDNAGLANSGGLSTSDWSPGQAAYFAINRCIFEGNRTDQYGGALSVPGEFTLSVTSCTFRRNYSGLGGGGVYASWAGFHACVFEGNSTGGDGGAILQHPDSEYVYVSNCLFTGNSAHRGGAMWLANSGVVDSTIVHNRASFGGGMFTSQYMWSICCIFAKNAATLAGPQLAGGADFPSVFLAAVQGQGSGCFFPFDPSGAHHTLPFHDDFLDANGLDNDPNTWADNDYRIRPRSPLIDAGSVWYFPDNEPGVDLQGRARFVEGILGRGARSDFGCYESQLALCPADLDADEAVTVNDFIQFLQAFEQGQPLADLTTNGQTPFPDGAVTVEDLLYFLARFEAGC